MSRNRMLTLTEMRVALARHDIQTALRIMQRYGYPQREIAALAGISQSEVSEVICGRRKIAAYAVLDRLVEGIGLPRGWVGLAYDDATAVLRNPAVSHDADAPRHRAALLRAGRNSSVISTEL